MRLFIRVILLISCSAQALMAAGMTVDDTNRQVHSLHGYFLRPGRTKDSIIYLVDRPRDGRSFSTRIVRAVQHGETIFLMTASDLVPFTISALSRLTISGGVPAGAATYHQGAASKPA